MVKINIKFYIKTGILFSFVLLTSCFPEKNLNYKFLDDNKPSCKKATWDAVTYVIDENKNTRITNSRIWYKKNDYRIEIYNSDMSDKQIIIIRDGKFYTFTKDKKVYKYDVNDENTEIFLRKVFVNLGFDKKNRKMAVKDAVYNRKKHDIYEYEMYRNVNGLLCKAKVMEWIDKKDMITHVETEVFRTEFEFNKQKKYVGPIKETYEIKNYKCYFILSSKLFEIPGDYEIIDFENFYKKQLLKAGKTQDNIDTKITTFTIR
ncbi:MAG: hypothetical protein KA120_04145 [Candidatus Goldbacteria bacterium]|nr:hypothetical protein [Candidatus Goldiibacteriota bacterium]